MSTTVTYKGNTLTTATNQTRTLKTAGKYMQGDIIITDITTASYTATITGNGNQYGRYVQYDSINYYTNGDSFMIEGGEDLYIRVEASVTNMASIYVNGEIVAQRTDGGTVTYTYTLPESNITINLGTVGVIRVDAENAIKLQDKTVSITPTTSTQTQTVTADAGYDGLDEVTINTAAMPAGSATPAGTITGSSAIIVPGTNTLTLSKNISNTPQVTAGYIASGTAGNTTVSLTANTTTKSSATIHPSASNQTIAGGTYLTGTQTINAVTTTNLTADNIKSGVIVQVGDSSDSDCVTSVTGTYIGGGGGSSYTPISVGILEVEANYTSTSAGVITYDLSIDPSGLTANDLLYIKIRDKAGKRNGYFYGVDQYYIWGSINNSTSLSNRAYRYNNNTLSSYTSGGTTGYGVYVGDLDSTGALTIRGRYNSSYSLTINGTYSIDIYKLEWPNNVSPFD